MTTIFDNNLNIHRYYFSRKGASYYQKQITIPSQTNTCSSPSPSHLLPADCTPLADIFSGMCFFFHEVGCVERIKQLSRYIVAYDGDIVATFDEKTTHILCDEDATTVSSSHFIKCHIQFNVHVA